MGRGRAICRIVNCNLLMFKIRICDSANGLPSFFDGKGMKELYSVTVVVEYLGRDDLDLGCSISLLWQ